MGVAEWFTDFCSNLQVQNSDTISYRYKRITKRLNLDFRSSDSETANSLYVGSYGRSTAIRGFSDLDMIFELPAALYQNYDERLGNGQSALLQAVRTSMRNTYPSSDVGADGQVVSVSFDDGMNFEVVPVFTNRGGTYTYPDSNDGGKWRTTDPRAEIDAIRTRNAACNSNLVPLCRMLRAWKAKWDVLIGGLLIDTLAYQFIENYVFREKSYFYYDYISRDCFQWMKDQDETQEWWRAPGSGSYVYGKGLFQYKAKRCYNIALEAIEHQVAGQDASAKKKWREIFGTAYPD